jgi:hypothetical protein
VHVRRLVSVIGEKEEPIRPQAENCRQLSSLAREVFRRQHTIRQSGVRSVTELPRETTMQCRTTATGGHGDCHQSCHGAHQAPACRMTSLR